jgi:hypothetical protein
MPRDARDASDAMQNYSVLEDYARSIETRLARTREDLAPLQSGRIQLGEREGGGPWVDITQRMIDQHKKMIATYENILKKIRADLDSKSD